MQTSGFFLVLQLLIQLANRADLQIDSVLDAYAIPSHTLFILLACAGNRKILHGICQEGPIHGYSTPARCIWFLPVECRD
jgi:hypothetical protein